MKANISPKGGEMLVEIKGSEEYKAIQYLKDNCVDVSIAKDVVIKDDSQCIDCGACVSLCPSNAISVINDKSVVLDSGKCLFCTFCITVCPTHCINPMQ
jgi:ferredoxin